MNKSDVKVSVVVPIYNMEAYLETSLSSVLSQSLKEIEVVCINDGSTDGSLGILHKLAAHDGRIRIINQSNKGVSYSRNIGVQESTGEYIAFLDPDDMFAGDKVLEVLYSNAKEHNVQISGGSLCRIYGERIDYGVIKGYEKQHFTENKRMLYKDYQYNYGFYRFIYSRLLLIENKITFPPYVRYQDPPFMVEAMLKAKEFYASDIVVYAYRKPRKPIQWNEKKTEALLLGLEHVWQQARANDLSELVGYVLLNIKDHLSQIREFLKPQHLKFIDAVQRFHSRRQSMFRRFIYDKSSSLLDAEIRNVSLFGIVNYSYRRRKKNAKTEKQDTLWEKVHSFCKEKLSVIISDHRSVPWKVARQEWVLRQYRIFDCRVPVKNRVVCYMSNKTERLGLADRLRTLRLAYVISQENNMDLSIYHDCGFLLEDYLLPNEIDWRVKPQDICFGLNKVGLIFFQKHLPKLSSLRKEWHVYVADNVLLHVLNQGQKKRYSDYSVFWKMFKLAPWLAEEVKTTMSAYNLLDDEYVAVHFRFCNFFEKVERTGDCKTSVRDKENMICCILSTLKKLYNEYNNEKQLVLFSDSNYVLNCTYPEYVTVLSGQVGHVANCHGNDELVKKTFLDLFIMSKAYAVHRITGNGLYGGNFSREAALIGAKNFVDTPLVTNVSDYASVS